MRAKHSDKQTIRWLEAEVAAAIDALAARGVRGVAALMRGSYADIAAM